jgi:hypothetical protein
MESIIIGGIVFFTILYFTIRIAVEDGVVNALKKYDSIKNKQS